MPRVLLNGTERSLPDGSTVADAVADTGAAADGRGVAVAVGGEVLPRGQWPGRELNEGEQVEVLHAVQGG